MCCPLAPSLVLTVPPCISLSPQEAVFTVLPFLCSADDEAMATEVTPPASAELTELGKCLMKQEVRAHALTSTVLSLYSLSHLPGVQPDVATEMETAAAFPNVTVFSQEHNVFFKGLVNGCRSHKANGGWDPA